VNTKKRNGFESDAGSERLHMHFKTERVPGIHSTNTSVADDVLLYLGRKT
jgi:hypothetical protein